MILTDDELKAKGWEKQGATYWHSAYGFGTFHDVRSAESLAAARVSAALEEAAKAIETGNYESHTIGYFGLRPTVWEADVARAIRAMKETV